MIKKRMGQAKKSRTQILRERVRAFQAKTIHQRYASDEYWEKWRFVHENVGKELKRRRTIQRLARREKNDFKFCKAIAPYLKGRYARYPVLEWPDPLLERGLVGYRAAIAINPDVLVHPEAYRISSSQVVKPNDPCWRDWLKKMLRRVGYMAALPHGRKGLDDTIGIQKIYRKAEAEGRHLTAQQIGRLYYGTDCDPETLDFIKGACRKERV
jgi:hypothetical protein